VRLFGFTGSVAFLALNTLRKSFMNTCSAVASSLS